MISVHREDRREGAAMTLGPLLAGAGALLAVWVLTRLVIVVGSRRRWLEPFSERGSHNVPTLSRGGIGFVCVLSIALPVSLSSLLGWVGACTVVVAGLVVALVGYIDDARPLPVLPRILTHGLAVLVSLVVLWPFIESFAERQPNLSVWLLGAGGALAWLWSINFFNFMDGIDGIAASEVAFIGATASMICLSTGSEGLVVTWALLAGAAMGFLVWNAPPARIFMGDVGSGYLGFVVGGLLLISVLQAAIPPLVALLLVAAFLIDATVTLLRRMTRGERWYLSHRQHAFQHLTTRWGSHGRVTGAYTLFNLLVIAPTIAVIYRAPSLAVPMTVAVVACGTALVWAAGAGQPPRANRSRGEGV